MHCTRPTWLMLLLLSAASGDCAGELDRNLDFSGHGLQESAGSRGARWRDAGAAPGDAAARAQPDGTGDASSNPGAQPAGDEDAGGWADSAGATGSEPDSALPPGSQDAADDPPRPGGEGAANPPASGDTQGGADNTQGAGSAQPTDGRAAAGSDASPSACDFGELMQTRCGAGGCHGGAAAGSGLDLTSPAPAMRLAGRMAASACTDKLLIDTEDPAQSVLYLKVTGSTCGLRMPLGGSLSEPEQACVLAWIEGL